MFTKHDSSVLVY